MSEGCFAAKSARCLGSESVRYELSLSELQLPAKASKRQSNLEFAGEDKTEQRRINGRMAVLSRSFNLYSDVQRADDIVVILPAEAGEKHFDFEERVKLVNPRITAEGYKIGTRGFTNYILHADDMVKA